MEDVEEAQVGEMAINTAGIFVSIFIFSIYQANISMALNLAVYTSELQES